MAIAYQPGLHVLAEITVPDEANLCDIHGLRELWDKLISSYQLQKVGEVYHPFDNGGFTAVVCLTESHMSIHTWPEFGYATVDVFLSNYLHVNDNKAEGILQATIDFLGGTDLNIQKIRR